MEHKIAPRYVLIFETVTGDKYYYNAQICNFVKFESKDETAKTSLNAIDFLTARSFNKENLATSFGIDDEILRVYIAYQFKGEKRIKPVFNNSVWAHVASTYKGKKIDFRDEGNLDALKDVYDELTDIKSPFANILLENYKRLINLSPKTIVTIKYLIAHEKAIARKKSFALPTDTLERESKAMRIYNEDRYGFYCDLKKRLANYREFRTVYLNYCKFKNIVSQPYEEIEEEKPKKKALIPPQQISMFDD